MLIVFTFNWQSKNEIWCELAKACLEPDWIINIYGICQSACNHSVPSRFFCIYWIILLICLCGGIAFQDLLNFTTEYEVSISSRLRHYFVCLYCWQQGSAIRYAGCSFLGDSLTWAPCTWQTALEERSWLYAVLRGLATLSHRHGSCKADVPDDSLYCVCCSLIPDPLCGLRWVLPWHSSLNLMLVFICLLNVLGREEILVRFLMS